MIRESRHMNFVSMLNDFMVREGPHIHTALFQDIFTIDVCLLTDLEQRVLLLKPGPKHELTDA